MQSTAVFWIRDGVLINRMPVNAVAFAVACLAYGRPESSHRMNLTNLINFAFETSGISCADKMRKLNAERVPLVRDVESASGYYTELSTHAAAHCEYFNGACGLLKRLHDRGALNFITSAVAQSTLEMWAQSAQAKCITPYLTKILGTQSDEFRKGRAHFAHARDQYGVERIILVADAVSEISTGATFATEFNIIPIGFANVITADDIQAAHRLVIDAHATISNCDNKNDFALESSNLLLPDEEALVQSLKEAKAAYVATGEASKIMSKVDDLLPSYL